MIKASAKTADGTPALYLSLSGPDMDHLSAGVPLRITAGQAEQLGLPPVEVFLRYSKDDGAAVLEELSDCGLRADSVMWPGHAPI